MTVYIGGSGVPLPPPAALYPQQTGVPAIPQVVATNEVDLPACSYVLIPAGKYYVDAGRYGFIQILDPVQGVWRTLPNYRNCATLDSDGQNYRVANLTGGAIGALVTTAGSGYTSVPTIVASAGGSQWQAIVGGALNTSITIDSGGSGYGLAPIVLISAPPAGGVQATATCTISGGAVNAVTVTNQGAGYNIAPSILFIPNPFDTSTSIVAAKAHGALTGAGTVTAVLCTNPGTAQTAVPTLTFSSGAAAATVIMCFTITNITVTAGGTGYGTSLPFKVVSLGAVTAGSASYTNPIVQTSLLVPREADIWGTSTGGGAITATGLVINDGGLFPAVPLLGIEAMGAIPSVIGTATAVVGGTTQRVTIQPL